MEGIKSFDCEYMLENLKAVVEAIKKNRPLPYSADDELLEQALAHQGTPEDIEAWAKQLADDVGSLTD